MMFRFEQGEKTIDTLKIQNKLPQTILLLHNTLEK